MNFNKLFSYEMNSNKLFSYENKGFNENGILYSNTNYHFERQIDACCSRQKLNEYGIRYYTKLFKNYPKLLAIVSKGEFPYLHEREEAVRENKKFEN